MLVRHDCPGKRVLKWLLFCDHYHISFPKGNFPSKSLPELLGRLEEAQYNVTHLGRGRMKYRFEYSKVQVAYKSWISVAPPPFLRIYLVYSNEHNCAAALRSRHLSDDAHTSRQELQKFLKLRSRFESAIAVRISRSS